MMRRRRPLLRAAAVGGGAYMAGKSVARRQDAQAATDADQDQQLADMQAGQAQQEAPPTQEAGPDDFEQLQKLGQMHEQGILTDEEFSAAKQKILATM